MRLKHYGLKASCRRKKSFPMPQMEEIDDDGKNMQSPFAINKKLIFKRLSFSRFYSHSSFFRWPQSSWHKRGKKSSRRFRKLQKDFSLVFFESFSEDIFFVPFRLFSGVSLYNWLPFLNDYHKEGKDEKL